MICRSTQSCWCFVGSNLVNKRGVREVGPFTCAHRLVIVVDWIDSSQSLVGGLYQKLYFEALEKKGRVKDTHYKLVPLPSIHVTQVLGTRLGLSASIGQATTRSKVMALL